MTETSPPSSQSSESPLFYLRAAVREDIPFIFNSWLKCYRESPAVRSVPNSIYYPAHHAVIERILMSDSIRVIVACSNDDHTQIYGYAVAEDTADGLVIHWIYCKHPFRGFGIGRTLENCLIAKLPGKVTYTHRVKSIERLLKDKPYIFNPYLLRTA